MRRFIPFVLIAAALAAGCGNGGGKDERVRIEDGAFALVFDPARSELSLERDDQAVVRLPADAFRLGRVDQVDDSVNYDPWPLMVEGLFDYTPPAGLRWLSPTSIALSAAGADGMTLALTYKDGSSAEVDLRREAEGRYRAVWTPAAGAPIAYFELAPEVDAADGFYGLGAFLDRVEQRGTIRSMQQELDLELESGYNEAHVPVPLLIGTRGWGLFVQSAYPGLFDLAASEADRVLALFGTGTASGQGLVFYLFAAEYPLDVTRRYYDLTGDPQLPARWALGPLIWRDENEDQAQVLSDAEAVRDLDLATTGLWIDRPYASCVNSFDFDPAMFDDPQAMIDRLHALGLRVGLWHTPYLDSSQSACQALDQEAVAQGYYPPAHGILFNHWGIPIDLTNPDAYAWWQGLIRRYTDLGIEGFKLDYAEDVVPGLAGARNLWAFADGSDERTMHAAYQLFYHRVYAETLPAEGGFLLCRAGTWGDQTHVSVVWPGDLDANFARHRETVAEGQDSYVAVGGLPASLIYALSLGPSGFPFFGSDTGGYRHSPPDKETFTRWFEQTALSSVMQIGTSSNNVAWEFDPQTGFDEEMLGWYRTYTRLHLRLWPYLWTLAHELSETGRPIMRPLGLAYPDEGLHPDDVYLLGPDLLVAPVVERGARAKDVVFPPGAWLDWWTGQSHQGPGTETVPAPLEMLPLYIRVGAIVPMLRPTIDAMAPTDEPERVDSYATSPGVLHARVALGQDGDASLFDGTRLSQQDKGSTIGLSVDQGTEFQYGVQFELLGFGDEAPAGVTADGAALPERASLDELAQAADGWFHDPGAPIELCVKVGPGDHGLMINR